MSNFHHEMICNRTSCVHDIVEFMVDHWIRIKLFFYPDTCLASHSKPNHDHCLLQWPEWAVGMKKKEETSATFKTEWGRNMEKSAGKHKMAKRSGAKPASNMNIAIQIWQCKLLHFILQGKSKWCSIKWSWHRGTFSCMASAMLIIKMWKYCTTRFSCFLCWSVFHCMEEVVSECIFISS